MSDRTVLHSDAWFYPKEDIDQTFTGHGETFFHHPFQNPCTPSFTLALDPL